MGLIVERATCIRVFSPSGVVLGSPTGFEARFEQVFRVHYGILRLGVPQTKRLAGRRLMHSWIGSAWMISHLGRIEPVSGGLRSQLELPLKFTQSYSGVNTHYCAPSFFCRSISLSRSSTLIPYLPNTETSATPICSSRPRRGAFFFATVLERAGSLERWCCVVLGPKSSDCCLFLAAIAERSSVTSSNLGW